VALTQVDHFLIQTADLGKTRDWYVRALGMTEGWHPDFKFPVVWLYIGEKDVLHLTEGGANVSENRKKYLGQQSEAISGSGVVDHIAFRAHGLADTMAHLRSLAIDFKERMVSDQGLYQLFMFDPNGVKIELNFDNAEATALGIKPGVMASKLPG